jgi:hypothetical protein
MRMADDPDPCAQIQSLVDNLGLQIDNKQQAIDAAVADGMNPSLLQRA